MAMTPLLDIADLSIQFPKGPLALDRVSLAVNPGEIFGLVGPNGAGKSTLLRIAAGLLAPTSGTVAVAGRPLASIPRPATLVGLMPDPIGVYTDLSVREYLHFFSRLCLAPASRLEHVVDFLALAPFLDREVEALSAGWQRRLALARVLLTDAPLLLLDEPAAGLDVSARADLLQCIRALATDGRAVVVSSHILPELQQIATRFGVLVSGRWRSPVPGQNTFTPADLDSGAYLLRFPTPADADRARALLPSGLLLAPPSHEARPAATLRLRPPPGPPPSDLLAPLLQAHIPFTEFRPDAPSLDRLFLDLIENPTAPPPLPPNPSIPSVPSVPVVPSVPSTPNPRINP